MQQRGAHEALRAAGAERQRPLEITPSTYKRTILHSLEQLVIFCNKLTLYMIINCILCGPHECYILPFVLHGSFLFDSNSGLCT